MLRVVKSLVLLVGVAFLAACGSEGGSGGGPTTYITPTIKEGTSAVAFATYSSTTNVSTGMLSFNVKSNVYTGIAPSDVQITSQRLTYTPIPFETYSTSKPRISPTFTALPVTFNVPLFVPGGGDSDLDNYPVFGLNEVAALKPLVDADPAKYSNKILKYKLDILFGGYEVVTNENVSGTLTTEVWVQTP